LLTDNHIINGQSLRQISYITCWGSLSAFEETELTSEQQDMVEVMSRASDVVVSVVNDILDTAKLDARKLTLINRVFDLWSLVEKTVTMLGERVQRSLN